MRILLSAIFALSTLPLFAQATLTGTVRDAETEDRLSGVFVTVERTNVAARTDDDGQFTLNDVPEGEQTVTLIYSGYENKSMPVTASGTVDLGVLTLSIDPNSNFRDAQEEAYSVSLNEEQLENDLQDQNISSLLTASRDVFVNTAAFNFSAARFRIRGYDSENTTVLINNIPLNELENGRVYWSQWGGLNDVLRNRQTDVGIAPMDYTFGGIGGAQTIDTRASTQWKQTRVSYMRANRSYNNRIMATHSTGMMSNGWAISVSGSRRWAEESYVPGTNYDAWAYFLSVDRELGDNHLLNFTAMGAPISRARQSASTQEFYDLAGTVYYNPNWGYQEGEKRNSRVNTQHQPIFFLNHEWKINEGSKLRSAVSYQFGENGGTALDWFNAPDPRPDYYRNGPDFLSLDSEEQAEFLASRVRYNPDFLQINWDNLYKANRNNPVGYGDAEGQWSQYVIESRRFDSKELNFNTIYEQIFSDAFTLTAGASYQNYRGHNYKVLEDLLGGDYYVNIDKFAVGDPNLNNDAVQLNLENPDQILREGDIFGYDYESDITKMGGWIQGRLALNKLDLFGAVNLERTEFFRVGNFRSGRFPDNSLGQGQTTSFNTYGLKGGATFKIDGRNYLYAHAMRSTRAPFFRNAYTFPRLKDELVSGLTEETITSGEFGYQLRGTNIKARATAFYTIFEDQIESRNVFISGLANRFGNYVLRGVDKEHYGLELAAELKLNAALSIAGAAAIGDYHYSSRPFAQLFLDSQFDPNESDLINTIDRGTVYIDNFKIGGQPQTAINAGFRYNSKNFWFLNVNFNYFDRMYLPFSPERRLAKETFGIDPDSELFELMTSQERLPSAQTVDIFGGKSFRLNSDLFLSFTIGVNNLFDNRFRTGGFENYRFDRAAFDQSGVEVFAPRYFYAYGTNYFVMATLRRRG